MANQQICLSSEVVMYDQPHGWAVRVQYFTVCVSIMRD
jgi:hypothetical protein